jgi:hypothetical protein
MTDDSDWWRRAMPDEAIEEMNKLRAVVEAARLLVRTFEADTRESYVEAFQELTEALDALDHFERGES